MALTQENVHYTLNSGPGTSRTGFMRGSRNFCQAGVGGGGGGGGGGRGPTARKQSGQCFLVINLFYNLQSGSNGFIFYYRGEEGVQLLPGGGGVQRNPYNLWFSREGGPDPLPPIWIRTWGRLAPLFAYRIMVYQNLNKTEKYHPTTTKRKKAISCWSR